MYYQDEKKTFEFLSGILIGAVLGAGIALLVAPTSGHRTRRRMIRQIVSGRDALGERVEGWADEVGARLRQRSRKRRR